MTTTAETDAPAVTCAVCGSVATSGQRFCTTCGALLAPLAPVAAFDALSDVAIADTRTTVLARLIDVAMCIGGAAAGALLFALWAAAARHSDSTTAIVTGAVVGLIAAVLVVLLGAERTGRGPGGLAMGTRVVDVDQGLACGPVRALRRLGGPSAGSKRSGVLSGGPTRLRGPWSRATATVTASLRNGRDPLTPALDPANVVIAAGIVRVTAADLPGTVTNAAAGEALPADVVAPPRSLATLDAPPGSAVLTFESGAVHWFVGTCVIGRNPGTEPGVATLAVPDLDRTLSKTHAAIVAGPNQNGEMVATVRDLESTNGTSIIEPDGAITAVPSGVDVPLPTGSIVRIGGHAFRIDLIDPLAHGKETDEHR